MAKDTLIATKRHFKNSMRHLKEYLKVLSMLASGKSREEIEMMEACANDMTDIIDTIEGSFLHKQSREDDQA